MAVGIPVVQEAAQSTIQRLHHVAVAAVGTAASFYVRSQRQSPFVAYLRQEAQMLDDR